MMKRVLALCLALTGCGTQSEEAALAVNAVSVLTGTTAEPQFVPRFAALLPSDPDVLQIYFEERGVGGNLGLERQDGEFAYWLSPFEVRAIGAGTQYAIGLFGPASYIS